MLGPRQLCQGKDWVMQEVVKEALPLWFSTESVQMQLGPDQWSSVTTQSISSKLYWQYSHFQRQTTKVITSPDTRAVVLSPGMWTWGCHWTSVSLNGTQRGYHVCSIWCIIRHEVSLQCRVTFFSLFHVPQLSSPCQYQTFYYRDIPEVKRWTWSSLHLNAKVKTTPHFYWNRTLLVGGTMAYLWAIPSFLSFHKPLTTP